MNKYVKPLMTVLLFVLVQMGMVLLVQLAVGFYELLKSLVNLIERSDLIERKSHDS